MTFWDGSTSRLSKIYDHVSKLRDGSHFQTSNSEMTQNSKLTISRIEFLSEFELSQSFWSEKMSHLGVLTRDRRFRANLKLSHLKVSCICLHMTIPPSMTFWAISSTPRVFEYSNLGFFLLGFLIVMLLFIIGIYINEIINSWTYPTVPNPIPGLGRPETSTDTLHIPKWKMDSIQFMTSNDPKNQNKSTYCI